MKRISLNKVMAKLADEQTPKQVQLSMMQDADAIYNKLVQDVQNEASVLFKVENRLKSMLQDAKELQKMERKLESMAEELGVDLNITYAADTWVSDLAKFADEAGTLGAKL